MKSNPEDLQVLHKDVKQAVWSLKGGKCPRVDNVLAELIQGSGEEIVKNLTTLFRKIWATTKWPQEWM